jgi:hypothetical protein
MLDGIAAEDGRGTDGVVVRTAGTVVVRTAGTVVVRTAGTVVVRTAEDGRDT